jgi:sigma-54 specific flagellar transcriptional regulator A
VRGRRSALRSLLDEIGDMSLDMQVELLRALQDRRIERVGSAESRHVDVRIVAATHRTLEQRVAHGQFREDLYFRLAVLPINVPPLRERLDDLPLLMRIWFARVSPRAGRASLSTDRP